MSSQICINGASVRISRVGFGCARIYGRSELRTSARLIETALACGIRHFDTAPSYGDGQSEEVLGQVLANIPDVTIATKIGIGPPVEGGYFSRISRFTYRRYVKPHLTHFPTTKTWLVKNALRNERNFALLQRKLGESEILRELDASMKRLKRSHIDVYLIHEPDQFQLDETCANVFAELKRNGNIGCFGLGYGRSADAVPRFGTIVQARYVQGQALLEGGETRIFHGILRHYSRDAREGVINGGVGAYLERVLALYPSAGLLISASMPQQIRELTRHWQQAPASSPLGPHNKPTELNL
jgi:aryl-alcohol dehydrogenase-like predicted oxidoreductase